MPLKKIEEIYFSEVNQINLRVEISQFKKSILTVVTGSVEFSFKKKINSKIKKKILINSEKIYTVSSYQKKFFIVSNAILNLKRL